MYEHVFVRGMYSFDDFNVSEGTKSGKTHLQHQQAPPFGDVDFWTIEGSSMKRAMSNQNFCFWPVSCKLEACTRFWSSEVLFKGFSPLVLSKYQLTNKYLSIYMSFRFQKWTKSCKYYLYTSWGLPQPLRAANNMFFSPLLFAHKTPRTQRGVAGLSRTSEAMKVGEKRRGSQVELKRIEINWVHPIKWIRDPNPSSIVTSWRCTFRTFEKSGFGLLGWHHFNIFQCVSWLNPPNGWGNFLTSHVFSKVFTLFRMSVCLFTSINHDK